MADVKVVMNHAGAREILNSPEVQAELLARAGRIKSQARTHGGNYTADVQPGKSRAHARVSTADDEARKRNLQTNALLKSIDAGR